MDLRFEVLFFFFHEEEYLIRSFSEPVPQVFSMI